MQHNTQVPVGKHNNRQHASPHHEVATDVKQMPIRPIIIIIQMTRWHADIWSHPSHFVVDLFTPDLGYQMVKITYDLENSNIKVMAKV